MRESSASEAVLLWDESFLWGIMALRALREAGLSFEVITAQEIRAGGLRGRRLLFVPGGWASNKLKALGEGGAEEIRRFVSEGGGYLGFCGGAGLATQDGLGLLTVKRKPTKERVPSFSGRIQLSRSDHPLWDGLRSSPFVAHSSQAFHAWWPSQFLIDDPAVRTLATYGEALPDAFSSDLNVGDVARSGGWRPLEELYGINLDPGRLRGEPAVVEASYGKGRVMASLIHFDTPDDLNGSIVLKNLWRYLGVQKAEERGRNAEAGTGEEEDRWVEAEIIAEMQAAVSGMIAVGLRNFLWFWRNPMLLQWRRGVRGLEYCTLYGMVRELSAVIGQRSAALDAERLGAVRDKLLDFTEKAERLLVRERLELQRAHITYERCEDAEIQTMRSELFSSSKSYGGEFKVLLDELDALLLPILRGRSC